MLAQIIFSLLAATAHADTTLLGIVPAEYELQEGSGPDCLSGELSYTQFRKSFNLKIESRVLIRNFDKKDFVDKSSGDCKFSYANTKADESFEQIEKTKCKTFPKEGYRKINLHKTAEGFSYTIVYSSENVPEQTLSCMLNRKK